MDEKILITNQEPTWCPGCGLYSFLAAFRKAIVQNNLEPKDVLVTYDIGCASNMVNLLNVCGFATLHGRSIPVAVGAKMANPNLTVVAQGGEGGIVTEGANHLIHSAQRGDDITVIINNNYVFGLTAGQASAATPKGVITRSTPSGNPYEALSAVDLCAVSGGTFLARTVASDIKKTSQILSAAFLHHGFSLVEVLHPCAVWAKDIMVTGVEWLESPLDNISNLIGRNNLLGILYNKER